MLSLKVNPTETERILSLYYHDEHFDVITKDNAFLGHSFYCTKCDRAYKARPHVCETRKCMQCKDFCEPSSEVIKCEFCLRYFKGKDCYDRHRQYADDTSLSTCQKWKKCSVLFGRFKRSTKRTRLFQVQMQKLPGNCWYLHSQMLHSAS